MPRTKVFFLLYAAATASDLLAIIQEMDNVRVISKGVLMPILMLYAFYRIKNSKPLFILLLSALVFSWAGDLLLLFEAKNESFFIFGLGSFLVAHMCYILINTKSRNPNTPVGLIPTQQMRYLFIIIMAGLAIVYILLPHLGDLKLPVIIYAVVLTYMVISALYRFGRTLSSSFSLVFLGACLFMISDAMLAIDTFVNHFAYAGFWVMLTYTTAQWMLVEGYARHLDATTRQPQNDIS